MKITAATLYLVRIDGRHPIVVELETDAGISGLGEAAIAYGVGETAAAGMIKDLVDHVALGKDPFRIEALWSEMYDDTFWANIDEAQQLLRLMDALDDDDDVQTVWGNEKVPDEELEKFA